MNIDIVMPKMGESIMESKIVKWHKKVGDKIEEDEIIFDIETDKVDSEIPSPVAGILKEILCDENEIMEVGKVVAIIETDGKVSNQENSEKITEATIENNLDDPDSKIKKGENCLNEKNLYKSNRFYSPLVKSIAIKENISHSELETIKGSGINFRVTKSDLLEYMKTKKTKSSFATLKKTNSIMATEKIPMDKIREKISEHMIISRDTSVHVTSITEVDMTKLVKFLKINKEKISKKENVKLTYMPFISWATIKALKEFPYMNASVEEKTILLKKNINLGFAVALNDGGLIVPNIKDADDKSLVGLAKWISELTEKARSNKLTHDDISEGTFTITNYGIFGTLIGTPIINQPEVGILGMGAIVKRPIIIEADNEDTIAIRSMMYLTLSHDHRLIDGMTGSLFLKHIKKNLENFDFNLI